MENVTRRRLHLLDGIRGVVLVSMIVYHFSWNMVYLYGARWMWYRSNAAYWWQQSICWTFILLSGFCWSMGRNHLKRGLMVFSGGALVTLVTLVFMPQNRVVFGVLTLIGSAMLLMIPVEKLVRNVPAEIGVGLSFALFLLVRNINKGYLGFEGVNLIALPDSWYENLLTTYLGFPAPAFYSTDYFSLFPWFFLFVTGYFLYHVCRKKRLLDASVWEIKVPFADYLGKHSLLVYLLHQPVLYALMEILYYLGQIP